MKFTRKLGFFRFDGQRWCTSPRSPGVLLPCRAHLVARRDLRRLASVRPRPQSHRNPSVNILLDCTQLLGLLAATCFHFLQRMLAPASHVLPVTECAAGKAPETKRSVDPAATSPPPIAHSRSVQPAAPILRMIQHFLQCLPSTLLPLLGRAVGVEDGE